MEKPYSNREQDSRHVELVAYLQRIEAQTTKTNERVSKLERWRSYMTGSMAILVLIGLPIIGWILYEITKAL